VMPQFTRQMRTGGLLHQEDLELFYPLDAPPVPTADVRSFLAVMANKYAITRMNGETARIRAAAVDSVWAARGNAE
jgi:hypothetical protein